MALKPYVFPNSWLGVHGFEKMSRGYILRVLLRFYLTIIFNI
jgi:hypothetical protein